MRLFAVGTANDGAARYAAIWATYLVPNLQENRADSGYDAECIFEYIFWMGMLPNIKQRKGATSNDKPNRKKAAERFNSAEYERRLLIEGVFGAEETRRYQLHYTFVRDKNQIRFAKGRAIAWNIRVLNRLECANQLHIPIIPYGGIAHTECA